MIGLIALVGLILMAAAVVAIVVFTFPAMRLMWPNALRNSGLALLAGIEVFGLRYPSRP